VSRVLLKTLAVRVDIGFEFHARAPKSPLSARRGGWG
jgi:hypothetical protein